MYSPPGPQSEYYQYYHQMQQAQQSQQQPQPTPHPQPSQPERSSKRDKKDRSEKSEKKEKRDRHAPSAQIHMMPSSQANYQYQQPLQPQSLTNHYPYFPQHPPSHQPQTHYYLNPPATPLSNQSAPFSQPQQQQQFFSNPNQYSTPYLQPLSTPNSSKKNKTTFQPFITPSIQMPTNQPQSHPQLHIHPDYPPVPAQYGQYSQSQAFDSQHTPLNNSHSSHFTQPPLQEQPRTVTISLQKYTELTQAEQTCEMHKNEISLLQSQLKLEKKAYEKQLLTLKNREYEKYQHNITSYTTQQAQIAANKTAEAQAVILKSEIYLQQTFHRNYTLEKNLLNMLIFHISSFPVLARRVPGGAKKLPDQAPMIDVTNIFANFASQSSPQSFSIDKDMSVSLQAAVLRWIYAHIITPSKGMVGKQYVNDINQAAQYIYSSKQALITQLRMESRNFAPYPLQYLTKSQPDHVSSKQSDYALHMSIMGKLGREAYENSSSSGEDSDSEDQYVDTSQLSSKKLLTMLFYENIATLDTTHPEIGGVTHNTSDDDISEEICDFLSDFDSSDHDGSNNNQFPLLYASCKPRSRHGEKISIKGKKSGNFEVGETLQKLERLKRHRKPASSSSSRGSGSISTPSSTSSNSCTHKSSQTPSIKTTKTPQNDLSSEIISFQHKIFTHIALNNQYSPHFHAFLLSINPVRALEILSGLGIILKTSQSIENTTTISITSAPPPVTFSINPAQLVPQEPSQHVSISPHNASLYANLKHHQAETLRALSELIILRWEYAEIYQNSKKGPKLNLSDSLKSYELNDSELDFGLYDVKSDTSDEKTSDLSQIDQIIKQMMSVGLSSQTIAQLAALAPNRATAASSNTPQFSVLSTPNTALLPPQSQCVSTDDSQLLHSQPLQIQPSNPPSTASCGSAGRNGPPTHPKKQPQSAAPITITQPTQNEKLPHIIHQTSTQSSHGSVGSSASTNAVKNPTVSHSAHRRSSVVGASNPGYHGATDPMRVSGSDSLSGHAFLPANSSQILDENELRQSYTNRMPSINTRLSMNLGSHHDPSRVSQRMTNIAMTTRTPTFDPTSPAMGPRSIYSGPKPTESQEMEDLTTTTVRYVNGLIVSDQINNNISLSGLNHTLSQSGVTSPHHSVVQLEQSTLQGETDDVWNVASRNSEKLIAQTNQLLDKLPSTGGGMNTASKGSSAVERMLRATPVIQTASLLDQKNNGSNQTPIMPSTVMTSQGPVTTVVIDDDDAAMFLALEMIPDQKARDNAIKSYKNSMQMRDFNKKQNENTVNEIIRAREQQQRNELEASLRQSLNIDQKDYFSRFEKEQRDEDDRLLAQKLEKIAVREEQQRKKEQHELQLLSSGPDGQSIIKKSQQDDLINVTKEAFGLQDVSNDEFSIDADGNVVIPKHLMDQNHQGTAPVSQTPSNPIKPTFSPTPAPPLFFISSGSTTTSFAHYNHASAIPGLLSDGAMPSFGSVLSIEVPPQPSHPPHSTRPILTLPHSAQQPPPRAPVTLNTPLSLSGDPSTPSSRARALGGRSSVQSTSAPNQFSPQPNGPSQKQRHIPSPLLNMPKERKFSADYGSPRTGMKLSIAHTLYNRVANDDTEDFTIEKRHSFEHGKDHNKEDIDSSNRSDVPVYLLDHQQSISTGGELMIKPLGQKFDHAVQTALANTQAIEEFHNETIPESINYHNAHLYPQPILLDQPMPHTSNSINNSYQQPIPPAQRQTLLPPRPTTAKTNIVDTSASPAPSGRRIGGGRAVVHHQIDLDHENFFSTDLMAPIKTAEQFTASVSSMRNGESLDLNVPPSVEPSFFGNNLQKNNLQGDQQQILNNSNNNNNSQQRRSSMASLAGVHKIQKTLTIDYNSPSINQRKINGLSRPVTKIQHDVKDLCDLELTNAAQNSEDKSRLSLDAGDNKDPQRYMLPPGPAADLLSTDVLNLPDLDLSLDYSNPVATTAATHFEQSSMMLQQQFQQQHCEAIHDEDKTVPLGGSKNMLSEAYSLTAHHSAIPNTVSPVVVAKAMSIQPMKYEDEQYNSTTLYSTNVPNDAVELTQNVNLLNSALNTDNVSSRGSISSRYRPGTSMPKNLSQLGVSPSLVMRKMQGSNFAPKPISPMEQQPVQLTQEEYSEIYGTLPPEKPHISQQVTEELAKEQRHREKRERREKREKREKGDKNDTSSLNSDLPKKEHRERKERDENGEKKQKKSLKLDRIPTTTPVVTVIPQQSPSKSEVTEPVLVETPLTVELIEAPSTVDAIDDLLN